MKDGNDKGKKGAKMGGGSPSLMHNSQQTFIKNLLKVECCLLLSSGLWATIHKEITYRKLKNLVSGVKKNYGLTHFLMFGLDHKNST